MSINAGPDGFVVHPLDLFPTNKNLNTDYNKIPTNTATLDGFQVHPIDLFVSHDNTYPKYNAPQNTNIRIVPLTQTTNVGPAFSNYNNPGIMDLQMQQSPYYATVRPTNIEAKQNANISYVPIPQNISSNNEIYSNQTIQNMFNHKYTQQNPVLDNTYNIINLPPRTIVNLPQNTQALLNNNEPLNTIINQTSPYNQEYNLYTIQTDKTYQIYPQTNNIPYIPSQAQETTVNTKVKYIPNEISKINYETPQIQPYPLLNIIPNINKESKMFSSNTAQITQNNLNMNLNANNIPSSPEQLLNINNTTPINKGLPYSTASYEPDTNAADYQTRASIGALKTYLNTPPTLPLPQNTPTNAYNMPEAINRMQPTIIVPNKKTIIVPTKKTIIIPKKTTVLVPKILNAQNNSTFLPPQQYVQPVVAGNVTNMERNNYFLSPPNSAFMPLQNNYSSNTISDLPRSNSLITYNTRPITLNKIYPSKNNYMINLQIKRPHSISRPRYNINTNYKYSRNNKNMMIRTLKFGNPIYNPRNYRVFK